MEPRTRIVPRLTVILVLSAVVSCGPTAADGRTAGGSAMTFELTSPDFTHGSEIPRRFTCEGEDVSPSLAWTGVPADARSLALIVDDPDAPDPAAPKMTWVHWVLYNLPPDDGGLPHGATSSDLPGGTGLGKNDWRRTGWGGPCPPVGRHRYFFKLYALDERLPEMGAPTKAELERVMQGHVLARTELVGTYSKHGS